LRAAKGAGARAFRRWALRHPGECNLIYTDMMLTALTKLLDDLVRSIE
jgi:hypothetical protein